MPHRLFVVQKDLATAAARKREADTWASLFDAFTLAQDDFPLKAYVAVNSKRKDLRGLMWKNVTQVHAACRYKSPVYGDTQVLVVELKDGRFVAVTLLRTDPQGKERHGSIHTATAYVAHDLDTLWFSGLTQASREQLEANAATPKSKKKRAKVRA